MAFSSVGKIRLLVQAILFLVNIVVLALAARVNQFQDYFFIADLFPLALSMITFVFLTSSLLLDFCFVNPFTGRAQFEMIAFGLLGIFWLAFNAFSTSRWRHVPMACSSIPKEFPDEITWCTDLQALKSFVWIEWLIILLTALYTARFAITQHNLGNNHIWTMSLARYTPNRQFRRAEPFVSFGKMT